METFKDIADSYANVKNNRLKNLTKEYDQRDEYEVGDVIKGYVNLYQDVLDQLTVDMDFYNATKNLELMESMGKDSATLAGYEVLIEHVIEYFRKRFNRD